MTVIERVVNILEKKSIQQKELCQNTGIKEATFSGWKKNYRNIPNEELIKIADYLQVPIRYLLTGEDEESVLAFISRNTRELNEQEEELLRIFNALPVRGKAALLSHAYELEEQNK